MTLDDLKTGMMVMLKNGQFFIMSCKIKNKKTPWMKLVILQD